MQIILLQQILQIAHRHFNGALLSFRAVRTKLKSCISEPPFSLGDQSEGTIASLNRGARAAILIGPGLRLGQQSLQSPLRLEPP